MRFSYEVDGQLLIKSALFPIENGKVYLVSGKENLENTTGSALDRLLKNSSQKRI